MSSQTSMSDEEMSQEDIERESKFLKETWYPKPRSVLRMRKDRFITTPEYLLLDILLHLENQYVLGDENDWKSKSGKWFFCSNKQILSFRIFSEATFIKARAGLKAKGIIEYKSGHTNMSTKYRIVDLIGFE